MSQIGTPRARESAIILRGPNEAPCTATPRRWAFVAAILGLRMAFVKVRLPTTIPRNRILRPRRPLPSRWIHRRCAWRQFHQTGDEAPPAPGLRGAWLARLAQTAQATP